MQITLPPTNRSWLEHGEVLSCTADSNPPATYHWIVEATATGQRLQAMVVGHQLVVNVCLIFNYQTERRPLAQWQQVVIRCVAKQLSHNATAAVLVVVASAAFHHAICGI